MALSMETKKILGARIKELRKKRRMSQEALAYAAGTCIAHISRIERGKTNPTYFVLAKISRALGITPGELVGGVRQTDSLDLARDLAIQTEELAQCLDHARRAGLYVCGVNQTLDELRRAVDSLHAVLGQDSGARLENPSFDPPDEKE